ncbi:hypothetical protein BHE74_00000788 [Ensete ventricosum]|nr:hypothetical protein GW17_00011029 [Ensete ventricosum]RWW90062.1 hypothetical protein BHE74_00000788 [Ensete ventricosum]
MITYKTGKNGRRLGGRDQTLLEEEQEKEAIKEDAFASIAGRSQDENMLRDAREERRNILCTLREEPSEGNETPRH